MVTVDDFVAKLKVSMENHSADLKQGEVFLPKYLRGRQLENTFAPVIESLARDSGFSLGRAWPNKFLELYEVGTRQIVDFCLIKNERPLIFFELESLDRSQIYLFHDGGVSLNDNDIGNKLWHYYGTLGNHYTNGTPVPKWFMFFLTLPDQKVASYKLWDLDDRYYLLYDESLKNVIYSNPFNFFDRQIKALARAFLKRENEFLIEGEWSTRLWKESQGVCELIFITCTVDRLILSRGRDLFAPDKEKCFKINWNPERSGHSTDLNRPDSTNVMQLNKPQRTSDSGSTKLMAENDYPPLTDDQKQVLRRLLPLAVTTFVHDGYDHVSDNRTFFEIWIEMPNMRETYASMGFCPFDNGPMYWTTPPVPPEKVQLYLANGYHDDYKKYLWKYVTVPEELWAWSEDRQKSWLVGCIEALLREDEQLRGM